MAKKQTPEQKLNAALERITKSLAKQTLELEDIEAMFEALADQHLQYQKQIAKDKKTIDKLQQEIKSLKLAAPPGLGC